MILYLIINYGFGLFCCGLAGFCFESKLIFWKIVGGFLMFAIFAGVSFPFGIVGVIIGQFPH